MSTPTPVRRWHGRTSSHPIAQAPRRLTVNAMLRRSLSTSAQKLWVHRNRLFYAAHTRSIVILGRLCNRKRRDDRRFAHVLAGSEVQTLEKRKMAARGVWWPDHCTSKPKIAGVRDGYKEGIIGHLSRHRDHRNQHGILGGSGQNCRRNPIQDAA